MVKIETVDLPLFLSKEITGTSPTEKLLSLAFIKISGSIKEPSD